TDLRFPSLDTLSWDFLLNGGFGFKISWEISYFPDSGEYYIGAFNLDSLPEYVVDEWLDMRTADSLMINVIGGRIIAVGAPISAVQEDAYRPADFAIGVYPNPFNTACRIEVPANFRGDIGVFDVTGRLVKTLDNGRGEILWNGTSATGEKCPSGIYYFKPLFGDVPPAKGVMLK
ncbi:MAG TPA: T9SS type A sorting domain-containing protein, partial [candidate division Zixibacteria bacterium]|nr:T9SS type A sorting domain-containing protein [candidate division Zixibacteria bacterium]